MSALESGEALYRIARSVRRSGGRSRLPTERTRHRQASDEKRRCRICDKMTVNGMTISVRRSRLSTERICHRQASYEHRSCRICDTMTLYRKISIRPSSGGSQSQLAIEYPVHRQASYEHRSCRICGTMTLYRRISIRPSSGGSQSHLAIEYSAHRQASYKHCSCGICGTMTLYRRISIRPSSGGSQSHLAIEYPAHRQASYDHRRCKHCGQLALYRMVYSVLRSNGGYAMLSRLPAESAHRQASDVHRCCKICGKRNLEHKKRCQADSEVGRKDVRKQLVTELDYSHLLMGGEMIELFFNCDVTVILRAKAGARVLSKIHPAAATLRMINRSHLQAKGMITVTDRQQRTTLSYEVDVFVAKTYEKPFLHFRVCRDAKLWEAVQEVNFEVCASKTDMTLKVPTYDCIIEIKTPTERDVQGSDVDDGNHLPVQAPHRSFPLEVSAERADQQMRNINCQIRHADTPREMLSRVQTVNSDLAPSSAASISLTTEAVREAVSKKAISAVEAPFPAENGHTSLAVMPKHLHRSTSLWGLLRDKGRDRLRNSKPVCARFHFSRISNDTFVRFFDFKRKGKWATERPDMFSAPMGPILRETRTTPVSAASLVYTTEVQRHPLAASLPKRRWIEIAATTSASNDCPAASIDAPTPTPTPTPTPPPWPDGCIDVY